MILFYCHFVCYIMLPSNFQFVLAPGITKTKHYENLPKQYTEIFSAVKTENLLRKKRIFLIYLLKTLIVEAVLMSTHNLCFGEKIRKVCYPLLYKSGVQGGIHYRDMFS